ncbi:hypothetical protein [Nocardioides houyundeii]|uniref:hypothetical protein n=1 Tax=Nocardioides houyundeii TaxID=2045452 RepID=UPI0013B46452|nr:hypothetical protein [Nocardioides houyundeii]
MGNPGDHVLPPHLGDYPNGAYWSAVRVEPVTEGEEDDYDVPPIGDVIHFMWDYTVNVPLWDAEGLLPEEPEWLRRQLGLGNKLIEALTDWGSRMNHLDGTPWGQKSDAEWEQAYRDMDARARDLVERLRRELGTRYRVVYKPW